MPALSKTPLFERFLDVFDEDKNGSIDFSEFASVVALFGTTGRHDEKLECMPIGSNPQSRSKCLTSMEMGKRDVQANTVD